GRRPVRQPGSSTGFRYLPVRDRRRRRSARRDLHHAGHARHARHHPREPVPMSVHRSKFRQGMACVATAALALAASSPIAAQQQSQDTIATMDDPRVGLGAGQDNQAGIALENMSLVSFSPKPMEFDSARGLTYINS